jgi:hypothetical protein
MSESVDELVLDEADLTQYAGIGEAIGGAIREIVSKGKLEKLRSEASPELAGVRIAISTAHNTREFGSARRADLDTSMILNCQLCETLHRLFRR